MYDVVRYNNGLNTVPLRKFTPVEMDIFWAVCSKMKRKGTEELTFDFDDFQELARIQAEMKKVLVQEKKSQQMLEDAFRGIGYGID